jgi:hypothetical protein
MRGRTRTSALRRHGLPVAALAVLWLFVLGSVAHFEHHLLDPACDPGSPGNTHACYCAGMHGGATIAPPVAAAPAAPQAPIEWTIAEAVAPSPVERGICATRGPPRA